MEDVEFSNVYEDARRAEAYAKLEFPGTYYLAYRDIPAIIAEHVSGSRALDFGCGTGRSTRFLRKLGFDVTGIDVSADMIGKATELDPDGDYRLIADRGLDQLDVPSFNLVLSVFTFDNIPAGQKIRLFSALRNVLCPDGKIISVVSAPEIYLNEWASFSTCDFSENHQAKSGDRVRIIMTDVEDSRPVEDVLCTDESYREIYKDARLTLVQTYRPLANEEEPYDWVNETAIAPWTIYVLKRLASGTREPASSGQ
jgi:SAM-dependent methyltransferase